MSDKLSYGIKEAAAALGLSRATLYRLIGRGDLPTFKIGTRTLILRRTLEAFLELRMAA
jgi:excisionase family DNA binding protein